MKEPYLTEFFLRCFYNFYEGMIIKLLIRFAWCVKSLNPFEPFLYMHWRTESLRVQAHCNHPKAINGLGSLVRGGSVSNFAKGPAAAVMWPIDGNRIRENPTFSFPHSGRSYKDRWPLLSFFILWNIADGRLPDVFITPINEITITWPYRHER